MDQEQYDFPSPSAIASKKGTGTTSKGSQATTKTKKTSSGSYDFPSPSEFSVAPSAPVAEKKKTLELPSRPAQEPTSLVTKKEVAPTPLASSTQEQPIETPLVGTEGELLRAPSKAYFEGYPEKKATVKELLKAPAPVAAPKFTGGVQSTGGELLRAPGKKVIPAETEVVTTYKKVAIPKKLSALNPKQKIDKDTMLDAIALHESGSKPGENRVGMRTKMKGKAGRASASGTFQFVTGTLKGIYNQTEEYQKQYGTFDNFKKNFDKDPNLERDVASRHYDQFEGLGIHAPGAWYAPALAEQAARGNKSALRQVPGREYGNKQSYGTYLKSIMGIYNKLIGNKAVEEGPQKYKTVEVKKEVVTQPEVTLPSNEQYDITNPAFYKAKEDVNFLSKDVLQKSKKIAADIKSFEQQRVAFEKNAANFEALAKANPADPMLPAMQKNLLQTQEQLKAQEVSLRKNAEAVDVDQFQLRKKALENYKAKAEQGNWGGWLWNKAISGIEAMSGGLDDQLGLWKTLGAQTLDLFGIKTDELEKKPWLLAAGGDMYRRQATKEMQARHIGALEGLKDKSTTEEYATEMEKSGIIPAAIGGLAYSAPAMLGGLPLMTIQSIGATRKEMDTNKDMPYMTESEKDFVAVPIAIATGFLEQAGLNAVLKGGKGPIVKLLGKVAQSIPENSSMDVIRKAIVEAGEKLAATGIAKGVKKVADTKIGKITTRVAGGALGEAETEAEQGIAEKEWKRFSNKLMGMEAFKVASIESKEYWDQVAQDAKVGAVGALILGGPMVGIKTVFEGKSVTDDDYVAMSSLINDPEYIKLQKTNIVLNLASGKITKEQAEIETKALDKAKSIMSQIPTDIPVASQRKAFELLTANNKIQAEMDEMSKSIVGKDPNLVTAVTKQISEKQALIDKNNQELSKLPQNAVQEQTTSEVPVQPTSGGSVQMAEGESQAEPQGVTQEGQGQEIELLNTADLRRPNGSIGTQGFTEENLFDLINFIAQEQGIVLPDYDSNAGKSKLKQLIDFLKSNEDAKNKVFDYVKRDPVKAQLLPDGSYQIQDGNHRANLLNLIGVEQIPIESKKATTQETQAPTQETKTEEVKPTQEAPKKEEEDSDLTAITKAVLEGQRLTPTNQRLKDLLAKWRESDKELTAQDIIGIIPMPEGRATRIANSLSDRLNKAEKKKKAAEEKAKQEKKVMLAPSILSSMVKALKEGMTTDLIAEEGMKALKRLKKYKTMSEQERQAITDEIRKKAGMQRPQAPSVEQVLGIESTEELVKEMEVLNEKLQAREESSQTGAASAKEAIDSMIDAVKKLGARGILTAGQTNSLLSGLQQDMTNPITRARFFDKAEKIINNAIYAETLSKAVAIREQIKRLAGNKKLIDDVRQAALKFARLSPSLVEDIDEYMENAQQFYDAIKTPKVTPKGGPDFRQATDINERLEYIDREAERQTEAMKDMLLDNYNNLVELGVISKDISLKEIKDIIAAIEKGEEVKGAEEVIEATRELIKLDFKHAAEIASKMLSGKHPLTGETVTFTPEVKTLIKNFLGMDLDKLSTDQLYQSLDAVNNLIVNEYVNKMGAIYGSYAGTLAGNVAGKKLGGKGDFKRAILTILGRIPAIRKYINSKFDPLETLLGGYFRSDEKARTFMTASKLYDIINMHSKAIKMVNNISKEYVAKFGKMKANGKKFMNALNVYERGIYADLLRSVIGTPKEVQEDFDTKMDLLRQTIKTNENSGDKKLIEKAKIYQQVYDKIKDAKNAEEVGKLIDPINKQGAEFWVNKWAESYDLFATIASTIYNKKIKKEDFYTPESWEKIVPYETEQDLNAINTYKKAFNFINQSPVSTMMDRQNKKKLPSQGEGDTKETTYVKDYDFDVNNATKLRKTMLDLLTASPVQHLMGFINSKGFNEMFPDPENRTFVKEKIYTMVNLLRDREYDDSAAEWKSANETMTYFASAARSSALTSALAPIQQTMPVLFGTIINTMEELPSLLVGQVPSFAKGFTYVMSPSFNRAINDSGYGIALRGLDSVASLGASDTILTSAAESSTKAFLEVLRKANDKQLKYILSKPDVIAARGAWASYYVYKLRKMGLPTNDIDWSKPLNKEAADFAESKVNQTLNSSVQETLGEMFASKKSSYKFLRNTIFAFASFSINMKAQINKDLKIIGGLNNSISDKVEAGKDLLRISGEAYMYSVISSSIMNYIYDKLFELYGVKESEEDKKKRRDNKTNSAITRGYTDMLSPIPGAGDDILIYATNYLLGGEEIKEKLPEERLYFAKTKRKEPENKFLFYEKDSNSDAEAYLNLIGGLAGVPAGNISNVTANTMLLNDMYKDKDGTVLKLTQEEKDNLAPWVKGQSTSAFGIGIRQTGEIANKLASQYIKNAKARAAQRKKERLYFAK